jgi:transcriptional regulator with XRE-family HTH domain
MGSPRKQTPPSRPLLDAAHLAARVKARRRGLGFSLRDAAAAIGVSAATLSRVESGDRLPGRENLLRIAHWLGVRLDLSEQLPRGGSDALSDAQVTTVEAVELHLHADRDLAPAEAEALAEIFRIAYDHFKARRPARRVRSGSARLEPS